MVECTDKLTSGVKIKMEMRGLGGEVVGRDVLVKRRCPGGEGTKQVDLFDVEATQVRLTDLL